MNVKKRINGWILINKPIGVTSFQVISVLKKILNVQVGHSGTLDPCASGFLLISLGQVNKLMKYIVNFEKKYIFSIQCGIATDSNDLTGNIININKIIPTQQRAISKLKYFLGNLRQIPVMFSAIKITGKKAYKHARGDSKFILKFKQVFVKKNSILFYKNNFIVFNITVSKGFYIRSFTRDLSKLLKVLSSIVILKRNKSNCFMEVNMINVCVIKEVLHNNKVYDYILSKVLPLNYVINNINYFL